MLQDGTAYFSADSGDNWTLATVMPGVVLTHLAGDFPEYAAADATGAVYSSLDGGDSWFPATTPPG